MKIGTIRHLFWDRDNIKTILLKAALKELYMLTSICVYFFKLLDILIFSDRTLQRQMTPMC